MSIGGGRLKKAADIHNRRSHFPHLPVIGMNFKKKYSMPLHLVDDDGLPRNREERLLWIRRKVQDGYYDEESVIRAVADAFLEPGESRRAGDSA